MDISVSTASGITSVSLTGEMDADNCAELGEALADPIGAAASDHLVILDLSGLSFIDSSGLSSLLNLRQLVEDSGGTLRIEEPSAAVARVLEITGLLEVFGLT